VCFSYFRIIRRLTTLGSEIVVTLAHIFRTAIFNVKNTPRFANKQVWLKFEENFRIKLVTLMINQVSFREVGF